MNMARTKPDYVPPNDFDDRGFFNRLNRRLFPVLGPPPLGPYREAPQPDPASAACPLCGRPMSQHVIERSLGRALFVKEGEAVE